MSDKEKQENEKKIAAEKAAEYVEDGMIVGLGTGSTVYYSINKIGELVKKGMKIKAVSSSLSTTRLSESLNIELISINDADKIDLTIDGADEVDRNLNGIKGGGGALLFEKILALSSEKNIWIVDSGKLVEKLGRFPLPVEVIPYASNLVSENLKSDNLNFTVRRINNETYKTDSGNFIFDLRMNEIDDPSGFDRRLKSVTGIVETGLFIGIADTVVIGKNNSTEILNR